MKLRYVNENTAILIFTPINRRYLTGFNSSLGYLLLMNEENVLFVDGRYFEAATKICQNAKVVLMNNIFEQINSLLLKHRVEKLLIEVENDISFLSILKKNVNVKVSASNALSNRLCTMRSIKSRYEIDSVIAAQDIAEKAFYDSLEFIKAGKTEREIAAFLEYRMKLYGSEAEAFETIAVSGNNSSLPHGIPSDKAVAEGDFITMDFGAKVNGYCSDMTRTIAVGYATDEMTLVYNTVLKAQENVEAGIKAGMICSDADKLARDIIKDAGYGDYFIHSTGHGIGLEVHEMPTISPKNQDYKLRSGQLVSNEPGIYLPGKFGVRIEDMLLISKLGCKNLTKAEKGLIIL